MSCRVWQTFISHAHWLRQQRLNQETTLSCPVLRCHVLLCDMSCSERREAFEAKLTPEQRSDVEITRLGLMLHPYHALQSVMGTLPDGPDGRKHLPAGTM